MRQVNIHEAKTHLSRLIDDAARGESFIIAKSGKPIVVVSALNPASHKPSNRLGFMRGQIVVPDDFDSMGQDEIASMFGADV